MFPFLLTSGLTTGALYAMVAIGLVLVYRSTGHINFSHGELFMLGGFFAYSLIEYLAFPYVIVPAFIDPAPIFIYDIPILPQQLIVLGAAIVFMLAFAIFFSRTQAGKIMQATSENSSAAYLVGIRVENVYTWTWAIGAAVAGAAAVLMAPLTLNSPDIGAGFLIKAFAATILGGLGSMVGAVVGGLLVGLIEQFASGYIDSALQEIAAFIVIMVVLVFRPSGLFGVYQQRKA